MPLLPFTSIFASFSKPHQVVILKRTIQTYLEQRGAAEDVLFAKKYENPTKDIDDCVTYI